MSNETISDQIVPGIGVGGMTDKYEVKILICYLLYCIKAPLSREQLNTVFQDGQLVNYFSFCDALKELIDSEHLFADVQDRYILNPLGEETALRLNRSLPKSLRDNVVTAAMRLLAKVKREQENEAEIQHYQNGFLVKCVVHDVGFDLLRFEVFAPDQLQAERIRERFLSNPAQIYQSMISALTEENG